MTRIVLAMSGGVDSSVAASLLCEQGHDVIGVFMRHGEESIRACAVADAPSAPPPSPRERPDHAHRGGESRGLADRLGERLDHKQGCCSAQDAEDARRVADRLQIPFYALDMQGEFRRIVDYFVDEYCAGRTPNPCVVCNSWIKFGRLFDYADSVGAEFVATGHYARCVHKDADIPALCRGADVSKDQSYALFGIRREDLRRVLFPVGEHEKSAIRSMAAGLGLPVADKPDSQEICFVTSGKHDVFIRQRRADQDRSGRILTSDGRAVGRHTGIERFTVGQRKGLGVAMGEPYFVLRIDAATCDVVIGRRDELARDRLTANGTNWLVAPPREPFRCWAKIRYNSTAVAAIAEAHPQGRLAVRFDEPRFGVAPGQAVVCYQGDRVLGGGWIE